MWHFVGPYYIEQKFEYRKTWFLIEEVQEREKLGEEPLFHPPPLKFIVLYALDLFFSWQQSPTSQTSVGVSAVFFQRSSIVLFT